MFRKLPVGTRLITLIIDHFAKDDGEELFYQDAMRSLIEFLYRLITIRRKFR